MKTQILILKLEDWKFKNQSGQELEGVSAVYLLEDYDFQRTTLTNEQLNQIKSLTLPAVFEVDIKAVQKYSNGKARLRYEINSLKHIKEVSIFGGKI